uniref:NTF2 domain-containing protein n=1 Tax=Panagrolaimus sp. JU765 TaxID=591449 RepID=A0AC34R918_9BILA
MSYRSRNDVKTRTMNRMKEVLSIDPDIQSRRDLDEDDNEAPPVQRRTEMPNNKIQNIRTNRQVQSGAYGTRNATTHKVIISNCASSGIVNILNAIRQHVEVFRPIAPQVKENDIEFYINDSGEAAAIAGMSRRISDKKNRGMKLMIKSTSRISAPWSILDRSIRDAIVNVLKKRFNAATNTLDLSDFGGDSEFTSKRMLCGLTKNEVIIAICEIIERDYSTITGLSLKDNRLRSLIYPSTLCFRAKNVKILDLSNNELITLDVLERIGFWNIEKLHIENNPLCTAYTTADVYTRDVQQYLPYVSYLDGVTVEPKAIPRIEEEKRSILLPQIRLGYSDNDNVKSMVETFLTEFYGVYDDDDPVNKRQSLIKAYYEEAEFSYAIGTVENVPYAKGDPNVFSLYVRGSRNIVHEEKWRAYPERVSHKGAMNIAVQLSKMPGTKHDKTSFVLDIDFFHDNLCGCTLRGLFRDVPSTDENAVKFFMRNFVLVSTGEGQLAIVLDTLSIIPISKTVAVDYRQMLSMAAIMSAELPGTSGLHQPLREQITGVSAIPSIVVTAPPPTPQPVD